MLKVGYENKFKKDLKRIQRRGKDPRKLKKVIEILAKQELLPFQYKDHALTGVYRSFRDCHI